MSAFIKMTDVSYAYDNNLKNLALAEINLEINKGEFLCVVGANGSGKSTLAKHLNGLLLPTEGQVQVEGLDTGEPDNIWQIRCRVGMVFQNPDNQIVASVVREDVAFGLENLGLAPEEIKSRVAWALDLVGMEQYGDRGTQFLSGGQKQRISIAGVMAMKPNCLVLDEPTAMLDPQGRQEVLHTISQLNKEQKITVVLITHFMEEALLADRIAVMDQGRIIETGIPEEVFFNQRIIKEAGLGVPVMVELADRLRAKGITIPSSTLTIEDMVNVLCKSE